MVPSSEIYKTTKEYTNTQKVTSIITIISLLEPSLPQETFLVSNISTFVSLLYEIGSCVTPERWIPRKRV